MKSLCLCRVTQVIFNNWPFYKKQNIFSISCIFQNKCLWPRLNAYAIRIIDVNCSMSGSVEQITDPHTHRSARTELRWLECRIIKFSSYDSMMDRKNSQNSAVNLQQKYILLKTGSKTHLRFLKIIFMILIKNLFVWSRLFKGFRLLF